MHEQRVRLGSLPQTYVHLSPKPVLERLLNLAVIVLAACALVITALIVSRHLTGEPAPAAGAGEVSGWQRYAQTGNRIGPARAPVVIVEFSDFQCPFCRRVHDDLKALQQEQPGAFTRVYRHFPIRESHPHAHTAALASECAAEQGRFAEFHDALFAVQDSIGVLDWSEYARRSGIPSIERFRACLSEERHADRIEADLAAAAELGVRGTPVLLIGSRRFDGALPREQLRREIARAGGGR